MPMIKIVDGQATDGILYDQQMRLAQKVGRCTQMHVLQRLRMRHMLVTGEIDVHCYVNPDWLSDSHQLHALSEISADLIVYIVRDEPLSLNPRRCVLRQGDATDVTAAEQQLA